LAPGNRVLHKDMRQRLEHIGDARVEIEMACARLSNDCVVIPRIRGSPAGSTNQALVTSSRRHVENHTMSGILATGAVSSDECSGLRHHDPAEPAAARAGSRAARD
jgi:hypothetical protein